MENYLSLSELNRLVRDALQDAFPDTYWVMAETHDVRVNASSGHCYLELVEKNERTGAVEAKSKAYIWKNTYPLLKLYFEQTTGQAFVSGLKVLVKVGVDFHEVYGYGLSIYDIDPVYTLGDQQRRRREIIRQLEEEGVLTLNKELIFPKLPQHVAIISSPSAAGYEDFIEHLQHNSSRFVFYTELFPAVMQGEQTERSIIAALDSIYTHKEKFDAVVIVRGGGATSDLSAFDSYLLAAHCAQFPLPVITGIGHERDDTVLDIVAFYRAKTPTAVADFLIGCMTGTYDELMNVQHSIVDLSQAMISDARMNLHQLFYSLPDKVSASLTKQYTLLDVCQLKLKHAVQKQLDTQETQLTNCGTLLQIASPEYVLSKGYTLTLRDGKIIKHSAELESGTMIETRFSDGIVRSEVRETVIP